MSKGYQSELTVEGLGVHQLLTASANNPKPHPAKNQQ